MIGTKTDISFASCEGTCFPFGVLSIAEVECRGDVIFKGDSNFFKHWLQMMFYPRTTLTWIKRITLSVQLSQVADFQVYQNMEVRRWMVVLPHLRVYLRGRFLRSSRLIDLMIKPCPDWILGWWMTSCRLGVHCGQGTWVVHRQLSP